MFVAGRTRKNLSLERGSGLDESSLPLKGTMRNRSEILADHKPFDQLTLEVLLDIRDLLQSTTPKGDNKPLDVKEVAKKIRKRRRPKKIK